MERHARDAVGRKIEFRRWLILIATAVVSAFFVVDHTRVPTGPVVEGEVAARTVKAPFPFGYEDVGKYEAERVRAADAALPVFVYDEALTAELVGRVRAAFRHARDALAPLVPAEGEAPPPAPSPAEVADTFVAELGVPLEPRQRRVLAQDGFPDEAEQLIVARLVSAYDQRFLVADRADLPADGRAITIVPRVGDREPFRLTEHDRVVEPAEVERVLATLEGDGDAYAGAVTAIVRGLIRPNLIFDAARTEAARSDAVAAVALEPIAVQRGETLFREGDKLTAQHVQMMRALQATRSDRGALLQGIVAAAFLLLLLGTLYLASRSSLTRDTGTRDLAALGAIVVVLALLTRIVVSSAPDIAAMLGNDAMPESVWLLVPVAGAAMLARILLGPARAAFVAIALAAVCGLMMRFEALHVLYFLLASLVGASSVDHLRERSEVLRAGVTTAGFGALMALVLHFLDLYVGSGELSMATTMRPAWSMLFALLGGLLSAFFVLAVIPVFEMAGFVTDHRMLELARMNHPLLRQLMLRAPGTYHHSVVVGTLAEAACEAIGANALQARIAAHFHDIGKAAKPRYFIENQRGGANPHASLDPSTSARILIGHVTEGARMAREHKLPQPIVDNILMHHGTGLLQFFFAKAQMEADDPSDVDESAFRYPGPRPNTREAGVVMLADKVEAATRTIQHPTEENIRAMINRIINSVVADHQFTECPLTFQEIHTIADTFVRVLVGIYHQRIEYPDTASISRSLPPAAAAALPPPDTARVGTITLELETRAAAGGESLWNDDDGEMTDESTDYESVRNLPHGEL